MLPEVLLSIWFRGSTCNFISHRHSPLNYASTYFRLLNNMNNTYWTEREREREREYIVVFLLTLCWCNHKFFLRNLGGFHHWLMLWMKLPSLLAAWYFPQQGVKKRLEVGLYENIPLPNLNIEKWRNIMAILSVGAQQGLVGGKIQAGGFRISLEPGLWNPFQTELVIFNSLSVTHIYIYIYYIYENWSTLLETNIYIYIQYPLLKALLNMIFLFSWWDMWSFPGGYISHWTS